MTLTYAELTAARDEAKAKYLAEFMARTRGVPAWTVAKALSRLTPGIDWRRCSRGRMADEWAAARATAEVGGSVLSIYASLKYVTLDALAAAIEAARAEGYR